MLKDSVHSAYLQNRQVCYHRDCDKRRVFSSGRDVTDIPSQETSCRLGFNRDMLSSGVVCMQLDRLIEIRGSSGNKRV